MIKYSWRSDRFFTDTSKIVENALSCSVQKSIQKFFDLDSEADDFQNLIILFCF